MRLALLWGILAVAVAACGSEGVVAAAEPAGEVLRATTTTLTTLVVEEEPPRPTASTAPSTSTTSTTLATAEVPEAAVFLAAVDRGLAETVYAGDAYEDPEAFITTGVLFCELLADGLSVDEVLAGYAAALAPADGGPVGEDDLRLGGVVLGASIRVFCPEFSHQVGGGS